MLKCRLVLTVNKQNGNQYITYFCHSLTVPIYLLLNKCWVKHTRFCGLTWPQPNDNMVLICVTLKDKCKLNLNVT